MSGRLVIRPKPSLDTPGVELGVAELKESIRMYT